MTEYSVYYVKHYLRRIVSCLTYIQTSERQYHYFHFTEEETGV